VVHWLKQPGDPIARGEAIAEIETDKATVDLESFEEGYFLGGIVELGQTVPVGTVIGYLGAQGEQLPAGAPSAGAAQVHTPAPPTMTEEQPAPARPGAATMPVQQDGGAAQPQGQPLSTRTGAQPASAAPALPAPVDTANGRRTAQTETRPAGGRVRASPVAKSIAQELGIDLARVRGSGPEGRIMRRDVEEFARAQQAAPAPAPVFTPASVPAPAPQSVPEPVPAAPAAREAPAGPPAPTGVVAGGSVQPLTKMRQAIARRMAAAKREMPHYYLTMSVDMVEALALRKQINAALPENERISVNDLIVKACALALEKHPHFNSTFTEEGLRYFTSINIGIAVALEDGLVAPAVLNCRGKSLGAIAREARDLAERARSGHLRPAELSEGTFTVSNLGMYGVETLIAVIQPGQSAILGVGKAEARPVVRDGAIVARETMTIALAADHRATDGAQGAQFLAEIKSLLEHPLRLAL
jgi:pyruvate dehydrogenase E2 component (dihydrolipoamide acetyltransferase)